MKCKCCGEESKEEFCSTTCYLEYGEPINNCEKVIMYGTVGGDVCGRGGCVGVIAIELQEGSCSCHINPPCSFCTDKKYYCPVCGWRSEDDERRRVDDNKKCDVFNCTPKTLADLDKTKFGYISRCYTHSAMIKEGFYPEGMTMDEVQEKIRGTFGGRFVEFSGGRFKYIAYTD